jgi:type II secretory pathway pseudopilin PulG
MRDYNFIRGFTIMDILLSAAIISLISSLVLFNVSEAKKKAEDGHMKVEAQQVSTAVTMYKEDHQNKAPLPVTAGGTGGVKYKENDPEYSESMQILVDEGYLPQIPYSPSGTSYQYAVSSDLENAFFMTSLNNPVQGGSARNFCSAVDIADGGSSGYPVGYSEYTFGSCQPTSPCEIGQVSNTSSCFGVVYADIVNYCECNFLGVPTVKSAYQGVFPSGICGYHVTCESGFPPPPPPPPDESGYLNIFKTAFAQSGPTPNIYNFSGTNYYMCSHNSVVNEIDEDAIVCDGQSDSDYCQCI